MRRGVGALLRPEGLRRRHRQVLQHQALLPPLPHLQRGQRLGAGQQPAGPVRRPAGGAQASAQTVPLAAEEDPQDPPRPPRQQHPERHQLQEPFRGDRPLRVDAGAPWRTEVTAGHEKAGKRGQHPSCGSDDSGGRGHARCQQAGVPHVFQEADTASPAPQPRR